MGKLTHEQTNKIMELYAEGNSIKKIAKITRHTKQTIRKYLDKKPVINIPIVVNDKNDELVGEFLGLYAGDGSFFKDKNSHYAIRLHFCSEEYIFYNNLADNVLIPMFGKKPAFQKYHNRMNLRYRSKNIYQFIKKHLSWEGTKKTYSVELLDTNQSDEFKIGFIRGSVDSDGHFSNKAISFASTSLGLMINVSMFLNHFGFKNDIKS